MPKLALLIALLLAIVPARSDAQPDVERRAQRHAVRPFHGWSQFPRDLRLSFATDDAALNVYESWLSPPRVPQSGVDVATAIWWLAETGDDRYVPTFLRFAADPNRGAELTAALYGLARTARNPASRQRLIALARANPPSEQINHLAVVLMYVGDQPARDVLRLIRPGDVGPLVRALIPQVLESPLGEPGRWPCSEPEIFARGSDGTVRCR